MRDRTIFVSLGLALGALGLVRLVRDEPESTRREGAVAARPAEDANELLAVKRDLVALRAELARRDRRPAEAPAAEPPERQEAPPPVVDRAERKAAALAVQRRAVTFLDERVAREAPDRGAASRIQAELAGTLDAAPGSTLGSVACGATLCRATLSCADKPKLDRVVEKFSETTHRPFQLFFERDGDALATTMYIATDGQHLPDLAKELRAQHGRSVGTE